jgi:hypothetical protein
VVCGIHKVGYIILRYAFLLGLTAAGKNWANVAA